MVFGIFFFFVFKYGFFILFYFVVLYVIFGICLFVLIGINVVIVLFMVNFVESYVMMLLFYIGGINSINDSMMFV